MTRGDEEKATRLLSRDMLNKAARVSGQRWIDPSADKVLAFWGYHCEVTIPKCTLLSQDTEEGFRGIVHSAEQCSCILRSLPISKS